MQPTKLRIRSTAIAMLMGIGLFASPAWAEKGGNGRGHDELPPGLAKKVHPHHPHEGREVHAQRPHKEKPKHARLAVPAAYMPPPGLCRIWYPGRAHGKQPKPRPCHVVMGHVPVGAWLISRGGTHHHEVYVTQPDRHQPSLMIDIGVYDALSGSYIRLSGSN